MRTLIAVVLLTACSSPPDTRTARAPTPAPLPVTAPASDGGKMQEVEVRADQPPGPIPDQPPPWQPHKCQRKVTGYFEAYPEAPASGAEEVAPPHEGEDWMPGATLDDKLAELNRTRKQGGTCDTRHRGALAANILTLRRPVPAMSSPRGWNRTTPPAHRDLVRNALALTSAEESQLARDGFVVPERLAYGTYSTAYYDIHRGQLPVYVTVDSILHAIYISHDQLFGAVESQAMVDMLDDALGALHCGLATAATRYPKEVAADLDLYLTVARTLLAGQHVPSELGPEAGLAAAKLVAMIQRENGQQLVELFGRTRAIDTSQYTPRGHYAEDTDLGGLANYFRSATWLSRLELNLVSRDTRSSLPGDVLDPRETPREAAVALALADLAKRTGALANIAALDKGWGAMAGKREDVSIAQLVDLRAKAGIEKIDVIAAPAKLRAAIGDKFVRTVNLHPNPAVPNLPVIATLLGPRITPDNEALWSLTSGRGPNVRGTEVGFMLGHDRALAHAEAKTDRTRLQEARAQLAAAPLGDDLYSAWLTAIRALADTPPGARPSFMDSPAFQDLRLSSAIAAYGQLRHNHVLVTAQVYDEGGCEIPDGYVEPAPATYRALAAYAKRGLAVFQQLDPKGTTGAAAYFRRLERLMNVLAALSDEQLANRPLSAAAKRFLSMIVERRVATADGYTGTFPVATFDGWYFDLFPNIDAGLRDAAFIADYATFNRNGESGIHYLGAKGPRLCVFVVDTGGPPRMMVGPVANTFQHTGPLDARLRDSDVAAVPGDAPWARSYTVPAPAEPALALRFARPAKPARARAPLGDADQLAPNTLRVESKAELGMVTIEFLDHHFVAMASVTQKIGAGRTEIAAPPTKQPIEAMWIKTPAFQRRVDVELDGRMYVELGPP
ncbi:MAG: DUF3160 domain-containing protein [Kofleriaceae bacterium]|nr:DUF3160 domain-containing protein [Kofleriaceae bacterium]